MLPTSLLLLVALAPADSLVLIHPPPSLRELCIKAPVVVLARPVDPVSPTRFTVLVVLRGKQVKVGQQIAPAGLVEKNMQTFDEPDPETRKPRPRRIDQALLFLQPARSTQKNALAIMPSGFRLCAEDGRVLVPPSQRGEAHATKPLQIANKVNWTALMRRARADLASVDRLHLLRRLGRPAERSRALLDWVQKRRAEFGVTSTVWSTDLAPQGWGELGYKVFDWIFEAERPEACWAAVKLYASLNRSEAPQLSIPAFSSRAGRKFLLEIAADDKVLLGDRRRAIQLLGQPITLWPASGKRSDAEAVTVKEREGLMEQLRPLLAGKDEELNLALVLTLFQLSRPAKDQAPKPATGLVNSLAELYREATPGALRDELARSLYRVAPERYRELSKNPAGVCVCLADLAYEDGELTFFLDLRTGASKAFEQPALILERPGALGFVAETKRVPLPVLNLEGTWAAGVGGETMLAVRLPLAKIITTPSPNPGARGKPPAVLWRVRVEGSVGKGAAKQTWKSEARRIAVRPLPSTNGPGYPPYYKR